MTARPHAIRDQSLSSHDHAALAAADLSKRYGRTKWALRNVTVEVPRGSICALVGPNGAGKTTLLRTWVGFERPTSGTSLVERHDVATHRAQALQKLGYVGQGTPLYADLTVGEHLALARHLRRGFDHKTAIIRVHDVGISSNARARELSGGERAQVALAIALGTRAPILLLDEPLAHLDPLARREFLQQLLGSVRRDGSTVLLASHVVSDIDEACDRLIILGSGRVLLSDSVGAARKTHRLLTATEAPPQGTEPIGRFLNERGEEMLLVRDPDGRGSASLDVIVLGHLAGGRELDREETGQAR